MKKKNSFVKLLTSQMSDLSIAPSQAIMKKHRKKREMPSRNPIAIEPNEYAQQKKVCTYCQSTNNCKYMYINNCMSNQPRYKCLNEACKKLFPLVLHNRPTGRTYSKKRGEDPRELQGLTKTCPKCGDIDNASFTYYNNDKQKQGLQPRFKCLNGNCKKHFQMRKVIGDDGSVKLVHTSRIGAQTSNKQQLQECNELNSAPLPTYVYHVSDDNIAPNANEQQLQELYNEFGGTLPTYGYPVYDANIAPNANEQQAQEYNQFGGTVLTYGYPISDANTAPYANKQQLQEYNKFGGTTLPDYDYRMYDVNIAPDANTSTEDDLYHEMNVQVSEVDRDDGLNNQESLAEIAQDYHTNSNPTSMSTLWGFHPNGGDFRNGDIFRNGDSGHQIVQKTRGETIQDYNTEDNPSMPLNDMVPNGDGIYQNGDSELEINQESHVETIQDYKPKEYNPSMPSNDIIVNGANSQNDVFEQESVELDAEFYWAMPEDIWNVSTLLVDGN